MPLPKRNYKETPEQYRRRLGIEEERFEIKRDTYTGETLYRGYGWYDPTSEEWDEEEVTA